MKELTSPRRQPRPVYLSREQLDELCERIIVGFCMERYGQELMPVPTEAHAGARTWFAVHAGNCILHISIYLRQTGKPPTCL
jgi:hypothetical protein